MQVAILQIQKHTKVRGMSAALWWVDGAKKHTKVHGKSEVLWQADAA